MKTSPPELLLGRSRMWEVNEVEKWLASRPTATKVPGNVIKTRERKRAEIMIARIAGSTAVVIVTTIALATLTMLTLGLIIDILYSP